MMAPEKIHQNGIEYVHIDIVESEKRRLYSLGYEAGIREFAWWKDGIQYVGSCGTTLEKAL